MITVKMKKLPQILVAILLVITPAAQGKSISSHTESSSILNEDAGNVNTAISNTKLENNTPVSEHTGHDNLLSDLAKISKDEETNVGNRQTIVGTEVSAATVKNGNSGSVDSNTRTLVTSAPSETTTPSYLTTPGPTSKGTESTAASTNANNDMNLVRLSKPTHIVLSKSKNEGNPFSKLITSNENTPEEDEAKSNDAVSKPQGLSPLISERTESTPGEGNQIKDSAITGPATTVPAVGTVPSVGSNVDSTGATVDSSGTNVDSTGITAESTGTESKQQENKEKGNTAAKAHDDEVKSSEEKSKSVDKEVNDVPTDSAIVCAGEKQTISCPGDGTLNITSADYGFDSNSICPISSSLSEPSCYANGVYPVVRSACQGQASCLLQSDGQEFGGMCPGQSNFLKVGYSCQNVAPSSSAVFSDYSPPPASPELSASPYAYQTSPYIPHPVLTQPSSTYYNYAYTQPKSNSYNGGYMNDNIPGKINSLNYGNYGNQGYYNNYKPPSQGHHPSQSRRYFHRYKPKLPSRNPAARPWQPSRPNPAALPWQATLPNPLERPWQAPHPNPAARSWQSPRPNPAARPWQAPPSNPAARLWPPRPNPAARPWQTPRPNPTTLSRQAPRPPPPRYNYANLANTQYRDNSNRYPQNYYDYYNTRNSYGQRYSPLPVRPVYPVSQYPRNSYTGSCYACQNCQQCSEQAYCQGCPKCKILPCDKKRPKEEKYLDPIDSLVEEFGKKTKGMTPMEMSSVVLSPAPKVPEIAHSLPLRPPPRPLEEDDDDDDSADDDSDENEFTLSEEDQSDNHEIEDHESSLIDKKTSVSSSKSSEHSAKDKSSKKKVEKSKKSKIKNLKKQNVNKHDNVSSLFKNQVKEADDDDDDEDGYDLQVKKELEKKKPKRSKIHRHKSKRRRKSRKHLSKRLLDEDENLTENTGENQFDIYQPEDKPVDSPYVYGSMFW